MLKKIIMIIFLLAICLSLSSCDLEFQSVDTLMRAPKLSGDERLLQIAFEDYASKYSDTAMKTAVNGNYKSSYIIYDIDGNGTNDALVLYSIPSQNDFVNVAVFEQTDSQWFFVTEILGKTEEIFEIDFADINGDKVNELLISWSGIILSDEDAGDNLNSKADQTLMIYSYTDNELQVVFSDYFTQYHKFDMKDDGIYELALFKINLADTYNRTKMRCVKFNNDYTISSENTFSLTSIIEIVNITSDRASYNGRNILRIFVDGAVSEIGTITEVIEIDENTLEISLPLYKSNSSDNKTLRNSKIYCVDIDNDGYIEIPTLEILPYGKNMSDGNLDNLNLIVWSDYNNGKIKSIFKCLYNIKLGYIFVFPDEEIGKMTVSFDEENNNLTFYSINSDGIYTSTLFSIKVFTVPEWENNNYNYEKFRQNNSFVYGYIIFKDENNEKYEKFIADNLLCFE